MNILDDSAIRNCTSCGLCATICARKAISIQLDKNGFYRPVVDAVLCNDCGLCTSVCYKFDKELKMTLKETLIGKPLYSAWAVDDEIVKNTTSGGIGDLLAHELYKEGYKVVGVVYSEDKTRAEHLIANSENDILSFRGSKYIQSYTYEAFKEVVADCRNEKFAVFGTPCQIYALNKLVTQRKVRDNFFFVDLYCHGCPSLHTWIKYQRDIKEKIGVEKFDAVTFRSKIRGWGGFYVVVVVDGKPVFIGNKANDKFYELFFSNQVLNNSCTDCVLRSTLEYTDIRMGDFWGHKYLNNQHGVSAISLVTDKSKSLFERIAMSVTSKQCDYDEFLPYQSWDTTYELDQKMRNAVLNSLSDPGQSIDDAIRILREHQGITTKAKRYIKTVLALFPLGLTNGIKGIVYKIR